MNEKTAKHPSGLTITFYPETHQYADSENRSYDSVTSIVRDIFPPFDSEGIASRKAARDGVDAAQLRAEWDQKGRDACIRGTRCHEVIEDALLARAPRHKPRDAREKTAFGAGWEAAQMIRSSCTVVCPEAIVFCPESCTAGTIDLIATRKKGGGFAMIDWKTNAELSVENKYGGRALPPFDYLHDAHLVRYSLQLNLYKKILYTNGYIRGNETVTMSIGHIAPGASAVAWIDLPDLSREAQQIMEQRRKDTGRVRALSRRILDGAAAEAELAAHTPAEFDDDATH